MKVVRVSAIGGKSCNGWNTATLVETLYNYIYSGWLKMETILLNERNGVEILIKVILWISKLRNESCDSKCNALK